MLLFFILSLFHTKRLLAFLELSRIKFKNWSLPPLTFLLVSFSPFLTWMAGAVFLDHNSHWSIKIYKDKISKQEVIDVLNKLLFSLLLVRNVFFKIIIILCVKYITCHTLVYNCCLIGVLFLPLKLMSGIKCQYSCNWQLISVMY